MSKDPSRRKLLECIWPSRVFVEVAKTVEREDNELVGVSCLEGHAVVNNLMSRMAGALFNLFAGNMVLDINGTVRTKRNSRFSPKDGRSQSDDKRRKLTGIKKN